MYGTGTSIRFENRALLNAVKHISDNLVRRSCLNTRDPRYASLLSDILGQSHYATIEILARKRRQSAENLARKRARDSSESISAKLLVAHDHAVIEDDDEKKKKRDELFTNAMRDRLVKILHSSKLDDTSSHERVLTISILERDGLCDVEALRRLWYVPKVIFEACKLDKHFKEQEDKRDILLFYDRLIYQKPSDTRTFNILYWKESCFDKHHSSIVEDPCFENTTRKRTSSEYYKFRTVGKPIIARVVRVLLSRRKKPLYEQNMDAAIETVLYTINADRFIDRFRESSLRDAGFFRGLHGFEYSRNFTGSLENLQIGKFNRMVKDIRSLRHDTNGHVSSNGHSNSNYISLRAIRRYCTDRDLLTDRALRRIHERYVRHRSYRHRHHAHAHSGKQMDEMKFSVGDFVRMYLAWVGCSSDAGMKYWFSVLDQDGDGVVGMGDIVHFYSERKMESEKRNGMLLADARCVWIRMCAMSGVSPHHGRGLRLQCMMDLGKDEREFVVHALLVRRADDGHLTNVAATMEAHALI